MKRIDKEKRKKIVYNLILIVCIAAFLFSAIQLIHIYKDYHTSEKEYDSLEKQYVNVRPRPINSKNESSSEETTEKPLPWYEWIAVDLAEVRKINSDVIGWIWFENEEISYPILYSGDNEEYLRKSLKGTQTTAGSIFLEGRNKPDFNDPISIIYGHNMRNLSMFGKLKYYRRDPKYYDDHQYFQIVTEHEIRRYQIFSCALVADDGDVYYGIHSTGDEFQKIIRDLEKKSMCKTGVEVTKDDKIISLSTCTEKDDTRLVLSAVLVDSYQKNADKN